MFACLQYHLLDTICRPVSDEVMKGLLCIPLPVYKEQNLLIIMPE